MGEAFSSREQFSPTVPIVSRFRPNALGTPRNDARRYFYGPGTFNTHLALLKSVALSESNALQFRLEMFNMFNHTQFFGPQAVNGNICSLCLDSW
jgi:hypothetical protein